MRNHPHLLQQIDALIATPSVSSVQPDLDLGNLAVIELLANWLNDFGYQVEVMPVPGQAGKANLIATLGQGPGGLVLAGHTDTVPFDDRRWSSDPFKLSERDQRLYGLGTADMKAFLALAIEAARSFDPKQFKEPLILLATADEETTMSGAKALVQAGRPRARQALIGEPTGLRPVRMHKGVLMEAIRLTGQSGHSSDPALGHNALEGMHRLITQLLLWRDDLQKQHHNPAFDVPVPTLNLGAIRGGDNPNRICGCCELHIDLRPLPGMDIDALRANLHGNLSAFMQDSGFRLDFDSLFDGIPAMETPANAGLVQLCEQLTGVPAEAAAFGTEAPYLSQLGMDTLVLGPGDIDQAHQPDEYLALERIPPMLEILKKLIHHCCIQPQQPPQ